VPAGTVWLLSICGIVAATVAPVGFVSWTWYGPCPVPDTITPVNPWLLDAKFNS
jgi:hypothetical protein